MIVNKAAKNTYSLYDNDENDSRGMRPIESFLGDYSGAVQSDGNNRNSDMMEQISVQ